MVYRLIKRFIQDVREHGLIRRYEGPSVEEIAERMKPIPYSKIAHMLPHEFAKEVNRILEIEKSKTSLETAI